MMSKENFEESMKKLECIVNELENGNTMQYYFRRFREENNYIIRKRWRTKRRKF